MLVRSPIRSPPFSNAGPEDVITFVPISFAIMWASVVLPRPGGPLSRICSSDSPLLRAASIAILSVSTTFFCPIYSESVLGLRLRKSSSAPVSSFLVSAKPSDSSYIISSDPCTLPQRVPRTCLSRVVFLWPLLSSFGPPGPCDRAEKRERFLPLF
ncbi:MAG: hypothetical protein A4E57_03418 [Syntrophorhabdaceae bacterium PtaU1.Bin034]|nr:MAG: hypothetical protein A4E57_03418 [Syntrophorhabdaceae bacterium PtaU1.Bin034]